MLQDLLLIRQSLGTKKLMGLKIVAQLLGECLLLWERHGDAVLPKTARLFLPGAEAHSQCAGAHTIIPEVGNFGSKFLSLPFLYWLPLLPFYPLSGISCLHEPFFCDKLLKSVTSLGSPPKYLNRDPVILAFLPLLQSFAVINEKFKWFV